MEKKQETNWIMVASWGMFGLAILVGGWAYPLIGAIMAHTQIEEHDHAKIARICNIVLAVVLFIQAMAIGYVYY